MTVGLIYGLFAGLHVGSHYGLFFNLIYALIFELILNLLNGPLLTVPVGVFVGLSHGILVALSFGLGILLAGLSPAPLGRYTLLRWSYARFLRYAAKRRLLLKVGKRYLFIHRLLRDYLAELAEK